MEELITLTTGKNYDVSSLHRQHQGEDRTIPVRFQEESRGEGLFEGRQAETGNKATQVLNWLKEDYGLGHGHAMAVYATFKGKTK
jgi:hypothetical protein